VRVRRGDGSRPEDRMRYYYVTSRRLGGCQRNARLGKLHRGNDWRISPYGTLSD
jgi:hypothetical protein